MQGDIVMIATNGKHCLVIAVAVAKIESGICSVAVNFYDTAYNPVAGKSFMQRRNNQATPGTGIAVAEIFAGTATGYIKFIIQRK